MPNRRYLLALALGMSAGCAGFIEYTDAGLVSSRNQRLAQISWRNSGGQCGEGRRHRNDFRAGYIAGYADVAGGSRGCPPAVPPEEYWASCYQTPVGHAQAMDWFAGYNEGVVAAQRDGVNAIQAIPTWCGANQNCGCEDPLQRVPPQEHTAPLPNGNSGIRVRANRPPELLVPRQIPMPDLKSEPPTARKDEAEQPKDEPPPKPKPTQPKPMPTQPVEPPKAKQGQPAPMSPNQRLPLNPAANQQMQDAEEGLPKPPPLLGASALRPRDPSRAPLRTPTALPPAGSPGLREIPSDEDEPGRKGAPPPVRRTMYKAPAVQAGSDDADWEVPAERKRRLQRFRDMPERDDRPAQSSGEHD